MSSDDLKRFIVNRGFTKINENMFLYPARNLTNIEETVCNKLWLNHECHFLYLNKKRG